ncbi:sacsin N-terminal ATP-binding-like domain-containing protein [Streptomyces griseofuscus]|uniref:sacsin N-terminal ATP-binding-like domain-containing protein n=1 Tax=Streptomyces griseofuscus TaxID=146922 RepID=UPI00381A70D3
MARWTANEKEAAEWAERLFKKTCAPGPNVPEPTTPEAVHAAIKRLAELPTETGVMQDLAIGARRAAKGVSTDRLQGLSEVVQNAEDLGATEVRIQVREATLLVAHNGKPVVLTDVIPLSMPWLTSKAEDAEAIGRFGIGLMTLFHLSSTIEVHSGHYRLRISESGLSLAPACLLPPELGGDEWTVFRVPLTEEPLTASDVDEWLASWGNEALLFLRHVAAVIHLDTHGRTVRRLALRREAAKQFTAEVAGQCVSVEVEDVRDPVGVRWRVCHAVVVSPPGLEPAAKAFGDTTPLAVALPLEPVATAAPVSEARSGHVHVRLPVTPLALPVRVHAAFDPTPSRQGLQATAWNKALVPRLADLWAAAVTEQFRLVPASSWQMVPLPQKTSRQEQAEVVDALEAALLERARLQVSARLRVDVSCQEPQALEDLALEAAELTSVLTEAEIERLTEHPALPYAARDSAGRYRQVLKDWADHGAVKPVSVDVWDALELLGDEGRSLESTIELAAVGVASGWADHRLSSFAWLADESGARHRPPESSELRIFADRPGNLAESLGFAHVLHPAFLADSPSSTRVREWLAKRDALLTDGDELTALRRLASYGKARKDAPALQLTDEQLRNLQDAFARLDAPDRSRLGGDVGMAVALQALRYDCDGGRRNVWESPAKSYLPAGIDRVDRTESFAYAAGNTPSLTWLRRRYSDVLRGTGAGLSPLSFLRLLGADSAPRIQLHRHREKRLNRREVPVHAPGSPKSRIAKMNALGAEYTLNDRETPDLDAVAHAIADEADGTVRRQRAIALIHVLGRTWAKRYAEHESVMAAYAYRSWYSVDTVPGFWLWRLKEIPWLDSESGNPMAPSVLRRRTEATAVVYGAEADGLLHPEIQSAVGRRVDVLKALGVGGEPTTADIVGRLRRLRDTEREGGGRDASGALLLYRALAAKTVPSRAPAGNLSRDDLRRAFTQGDGLVLTDAGWKTPNACLRGTPLFGRLRPFAPHFTGGEALWQMLGVPEPGADDAIAVIRELVPSSPEAKRKEPDAETQTVLLQSLQFLESLASSNPEALKGRPLRRLPLWTSRGWTSRRPVYAVADEAVAALLGAALAESGSDAAVWRPGAEMEHFRGLIDRLGVTVVGPDDTAPHVTGRPLPDPHATARLAAAVAHLREDLQRNDPGTARELTCTWEELASLLVCVEPGLTCTVTLPGPAPLVHFPIETAIDTGQGVMYVRSTSALARFSHAGRTLAGRFRARRREVAYAWVAAWERAEAGLSAIDITRAEDRISALNEAADAEEQQRLAAFHGEIHERHKKARARTPGDARPGKRPADAQVPRHVHAPGQFKERHLVDPTELRPVFTDSSIVPQNDRSRSDASGSRTSSSSGRPSLSRPSSSSAAPQQRSGVKMFTPQEQEGAALALVRAALARDSEELRDLRAQRGVGADSVDELNRFYEVKSFLGAEEDSVSLTPHEFERAATESNFFLVVVSGLQRGAGIPTTVRIILDPLRKLSVRTSESVTLTGVRGCGSLQIPFEQVE